MGVDKEKENDVFEQLTDKQRAFVKEYIVDFNATQAAIRAGYSEDSARQIGTENLSKPSIQNALEIEKKARDRRVEISQDRIIEELKAIALSNIEDYASVQDRELIVGYEKNAKGKPDKNKPIKRTVREVLIKCTSNIDRNKLAAVSEIKQTKDGISMKLWDKLKALELLGKYLGMWKDNAEVNVTNNMSAAPIDDALKEWKKNKK